MQWLLWSTFIMIPNLVFRLQYYSNTGTTVTTTVRGIWILWRYLDTKCFSNMPSTHCINCWEQGGRGSLAWAVTFGWWTVLLNFLLFPNSWAIRLWKMCSSTTSSFSFYPRDFSSFSSDVIFCAIGDHPQCSEKRYLSTVKPAKGHARREQNESTHFSQQISRAT